MSVFISWRIEKAFINYYHAKTLGYGVKPQLIHYFNIITSKDVVNHFLQSRL